MREEMAKRIAKTIVKLNKNFSKPLLVWKPEFQLSPPPKDPPTPASDLCRRTVVTRSTESII